jgi:hypothetical protein
MAGDFGTAQAAHHPALVALRFKYGIHRAIFESRCCRMCHCDAGAAVTEVLISANDSANAIVRSAADDEGCVFYNGR